MAPDRVSHELSLYHIVDEYTFSEEDLAIPEAERNLLERVDRAFIHSPGLLEKKGHLNPNTFFLPNGVDFAAVTAYRPEPADLADIPRPRIGYCGWVKPQLDWELIRRLTRDHEDWFFVFVGGVTPHRGTRSTIAELRERPNVHFLGTKKSAELMAYPTHFDVCIMPYRRTPHTSYIYPLKLHEYLASGRPVVGTPIRTLRDFEDMIELASTPEEWSRALKRALQTENDTRERVEARLSVARAHDWDRIVYQVVRTIAEGLGGNLPERLSRLPLPSEWKEAPTR
jgi:glycosyltransferase involved in cell wall biosynthesis